ncbi:hypothetical protein ACK8P5_21795 [Paenibacillus sp. EC2-1]|uniref:hypothetical protein n=1 Tax=Paenibacillus sp. EC2-1 TaxID=3388665 RepID=UPI003BEF0BD3
MKEDISTLPLWLLVLLCILVLLQGAWLFRNARSRDLGKMAWFWGLWGSISLPVPLLLYWLIVIRRDYRKN